MAGSKGSGDGPTPARGPIPRYNTRFIASISGDFMAVSLNPLDLYDVRSLLSDEERLVQDSVGRFVDERVLPIIGDCFDQARFPRELIPEIASLGLLGATIPEAYGGGGMNAVMTRRGNGDTKDAQASAARPQADRPASTRRARRRERGRSAVPVVETAVMAAPS